MSEQQHSPGPWGLLLPLTPGSAFTIAPVGDQRFKIGQLASVACIPKDWGDHTANAFLIAAAPELLSALEDLLDIFGNVYEDEGYHDSFERFETVKNARAAIAKARRKS